MGKKYVADFETATWYEDKTHVWAWAICDIDNFENIQYGNDISSFFDFCRKEENPTIYFHNLKFDGSFITWFALYTGFKWVKDKSEVKDKTFTTLINNFGQFYSIVVYFKKGNKCYKKVTFIDSLKIIPFKVESIPKLFGLEENKLSIDYKEFKKMGHELTEHEINYIKHDVVIVAKSLKHLFDEGLDKMTQGSNALNDFKKLLSKSKFNHYFPSIDYPLYEEIKKSYKGGFTYLNPLYKEIDVKNGTVIDVNSLYPYIMYDRLLPFDEPIYFKGKYKEDKIYNLYIQMITCRFTLKENKIPTIQIKKHSSFKQNEYLENSNDEFVTLVLTNIDLKLFLENYNVENSDGKNDVDYIAGWKFKSTKGIFKDYIDKWITKKIEAGKEGKEGQKTMAKLMLNSLYGKFASSMIGSNKVPYLGDDEILHYKLQEFEISKEEYEKNKDKATYHEKDGLYYTTLEQRKGVYIPIASFITSYAREKTIRTSGAIMDYSIKKYGENKYIYSDTDSIHCLLTEEELKQCGVEIHNYNLGAWKVEGKFKRARFIRQKCYIEEFEDGLHITCAGMPTRCYKHVTWDNYHTGFTCGDKLTYKHVKGGVILKETEFTIKEL